MCELLGMSFNQPVLPSLSFRGFTRRGEYNPDGWGLAYYPDKSVQVIKEELSSAYSSLSLFLKDYVELKSQIFLSHVRYSSSGGISYKNTHPFQRELFGQEYVFAHNGTLKDYGRLHTTQNSFAPVGETDSEYAFCFLLNLIERENIRSWEIDGFKWLHTQLKEINQIGHFNCLLSNGELLFCYHDRGDYKGLCFVQREAPFPVVRLQDEDYEINLREEKKRSQRGVVVATNPLTNEEWKHIAPGELLVIKKGKVLYSSLGREEEVAQPMCEREIEILSLLRAQSERVSVHEISKLGPREEVLSAIESLCSKGFIRQDSRDTVASDDDQATYYTQPSKREKIDRRLMGLDVH